MEKGVLALWRVESGCQHPNLPASSDVCSGCAAPLHSRCSSPPVNGRFYCGRGSSEGSLCCQLKGTWDAAWRSWLGSMAPRAGTGKAKSSRLCAVLDSDGKDAMGHQGATKGGSCSTGLGVSSRRRCHDGKKLRFNLLGVSVTPANSWWGVGTSTSRKIVRLLSDKDANEAPIPVAETTLEGVHAFPDAWRLLPCPVNLLPQLNDFETEEDARQFEEGTGDGSNESVTGQLLLAQTLLAADSPVTVVATGPLTALAWVLDNFPEASSKIDKVLIMGGAIDVPGNVFEDGFDGTAEWNIFWDAAAAKRVWDSDLKLVLTPLDATNDAPVTKDLILRLGRQPESAASSLVATIWSIVGAQLLEVKTPFYVWDLLTAVQLVHPELFTTTEVECDIVVDGASEGRTMRTGQSDASNRGQGRNVTVIGVRDVTKLFDAIVGDLGSP